MNTINAINNNQSFTGNVSPKNVKKCLQAMEEANFQYKLKQALPEERQYIFIQHNLTKINQMNLFKKIKNVLKNLF